MRAGRTRCTRIDHVRDLRKAHIWAQKFTNTYHDLMSNGNVCVFMQAGDGVAYFEIVANPLPMEVGVSEVRDRTAGAFF